MKAIISISNVVAGVGKTTVAVHLAIEFSRRGHKTLLIDADPQAHATSFFMSADLIVGRLADTLCPPLFGSRHNFARWDVFAPSSFEYLYVVPSAIRLATFERMQLSHITDLKARLATIEGSYDFIIIDTPSSLTLLTQSCLSASTHVLGVGSPNNQSLAGLRLLADFIGNMPCVTRPAWLGVVCNRFNCRGRESGAFYEDLKEDWDELLFETMIHRDVRIEQSAERGETIADARSSDISTASDSFAQLADELLSRIEVTGDVLLPPRAVQGRTYY